MFLLQFGSIQIFVKTKQRYFSVITLIIEIITDISNYVPTMITMAVVTTGTRGLRLLVGIKHKIPGIGLSVLREPKWKMLRVFLTSGPFLQNRSFSHPLGVVACGRSHLKL